APVAPAMVGAPRVTPLSPPSISTSPNFTFEPASPSSFSTTMTSPGWTRYCLPPVLITAYMLKPQRNAKRIAPVGDPRGRRAATYTDGGCGVNADGPKFPAPPPAARRPAALGGRNSLDCYEVTGYAADDDSS